MVFVLLFGMTGLSARAEEAIQVLDGRVEEVSPARSELVVLYYHPVSRNLERQVFRVDSATGLEDGLRLADLRKQDPVSIDYLEDGRTARAIQIKRVPMKGVPKELRRF